MNLQKYICNKYNNLKNDNIVITPTSIDTSSIPPKVIPIQKRGNGSLNLTGEYTGQEDKTYFLYISDELPDSGDITISKPTFQGAGNGTLKVIEAKNLTTQKIQIKCIDTGVDTQTAKINLFGLSFIANINGSPGNSINIQVSNNITLTDSTHKTPTKLSEGENNIEDDVWNFDFFREIVSGDQLPYSNDNGGTLQRIMFESDPYTTYLVWCEYNQTGKLIKKFSQNINGFIPKNNKIFYVNGSKTITITDGVYTNTLTDIRTIFDFHQALVLLGDDALIIPEDTSLYNNRLEGEYAIIEFNLTTDQYFLPPVITPTLDDWKGLKNLSINANAIKETIYIRKVEDSVYWKVSGSISGEMGLIQAGYNFSWFDNVSLAQIAAGLSVSPYIAFLLPTMNENEDENDINNFMSFTYKYIGSNEAGNVDPQACFYFDLGANAHSMTVTFTYTQAEAACDCPDFFFNQECLGNEEGGEDTMAYFPIKLYNWTIGKQQDMRQQFEDTGISIVGDENPFDYYTSDIFQIFFDLANKIFNLNENDETRILALADLYQSLVTEGLTIKEFVDPSNHVLWEWDDSANEWVSTAVATGISQTDADYDVDLKKRILQEWLEYDSLYGQKKNSIIGSDCYQEDPTATAYWLVEIGSIAYKKAYTGLEYYSHVQNAAGDLINTREFGVKIEEPCSGNFNFGDKFVVYVLGNNPNNDYDNKQEIKINIFPAQNKYLKGGITGNDRYIFSVNGENNSFANIELEKGSMANLFDDKLLLELNDGNIPFQVNDKFFLYIEGGHYKYYTGSTFSSDISITNKVQSWVDGLNVLFSNSTYKNFYKSDLWKIILEQSNKVINLLDVDTFDTFNGTLPITFDLGSSLDNDCFVLSNHNIPDGETITIELSNSPTFASILYSNTISLSSIIYDVFDTVTARYFRISSSYSGSIEVGFIFLGEAITPNFEATVRNIDKWDLRRSGGKSQHDTFNYKRKGFTIDYQEKTYIKTKEAYDQIIDFIDYVKENNNESIFFIPSQNRTEIIKGKVDSDSLEPSQPIPYQAPNSTHLYKFSLQVIGNL